MHLIIWNYLMMKTLIGPMMRLGFPNPALHILYQNNKDLLRLANTPLVWNTARALLAPSLSEPLWSDSLTGDISRFSPRIDRIFPWEAPSPFLVLKMKDFRNFVVHYCILVFDAEITNLKNKEATVNPEPKNPRRFFRKPETLNPEPLTLSLLLKFQPKTLSPNPSNIALKFLWKKSGQFEVKILLVNLWWTMFLSLSLVYLVALCLSCAI